MNLFTIFYILEKIVFYIFSHNNINSIKHLDNTLEKILNSTSLTLK